MTDAYEEPQGAALRTYEVTLSHDLVTEDFPPTLRLPSPLPVEPFDPDLARSRYIAALPEIAGSRPGWRSTAWQGQWAQRSGGLDPQEAAWWWRAWSSPAAWTDARADHPGLARLDDSPSSPDAASVKAVWQAMIAACEARLSGRAWWFGLMWAPRLWLEFLSAVEVIDLLVETVPASELRHLWGALSSRPDGGEEAQLTARVEALIPTLGLHTNEGRYTALRLLEVVPAASPEALLDALVSGDGERVDPEVARGALALVGDQARAALYMEVLPLPVRVESVAEALAWGGWAGLGAWCITLYERQPAELEPLLPMLLQLHAPHVVPAMLMLLRHATTRRAAYSWLIDEGANAIAGLLGALGGPCDREAARLLDEYIARGHGALIERLSAAGWG